MSLVGSISITDFALRHFNPDFAGTKIQELSPQEFLDMLAVVRRGDHDEIMASVRARSRVYFRPWVVGTHGTGGHTSEAPGYAPFCRHLLVRNFTDALMGAAAITEHNEHLLQTGYKARRESELPVLARWFERDELMRQGYRQDSPWLDLILYTKEHLAEEGSEIDTDWGIVSINSASGPESAPMPPITAMRNALGVAEGGSGAPLDREYYLRCVEYWSKHAVIK